MMNGYWLRCSCIDFDELISLSPFVYLLNVSKTNRHTDGLLKSGYMMVIIKFHDIFFKYLNNKKTPQLFWNETVAINMIFFFTKISVNISAQ